MSSPAALAYFWGEDALGLEHASRAWVAEHEKAAGAPIETWRASIEDEASGATSAGEGPLRPRVRLLDELEQRVTTAPLFGGGTVVLVRQPAALLRESAARQRTLGLLERVAPGNALAFVDLVASGARVAAGNGVLLDAVAQLGGHVEYRPALTRERMEGWLERRANELGVRLAAGAARLLAERVGAWVRESDIDRRRQSELANAELEKLALYRPRATISREDVAELVEEAVPGSTWAFLDAIGYRRAGEAARLAERLLAAGTPLPVLISQLHRRLRELIVVRDHLAAGARPPELARALTLQPFRAQKLAEQARTWQPDDLDGALRGLLDLDLLSKGIAADGSPRSLSDLRSRLALAAWIGEAVRRPGRSAAAAGGRRSLGA